MKKLRRSDVGIEYLKQLTVFAEEHGIQTYDKDGIGQFLEHQQSRLVRSADIKSRIEGLKAESLFLAVASALSKVRLVKEEDSGTLYYSGDDVSPPDFKIVTEDDRSILVEVKRSSSSTEFKLGSDAYVQKLRRYASLLRMELYVAIFWGLSREWTLTHIENFRPGRAGVERWTISYQDAFLHNEMIVLGDCLLASLPPLRFRVTFDAAKSDPVPPDRQGTYRLVIQNVQLMYGDSTLRGESARLASELICNGTWDVYEQEANNKNDRLIWVDHLIGPPHWDDTSDQWDGAPVLIGALSQIISNAYLNGACNTIHTSSKDSVLLPDHFRSLLPTDFSSLDFPLYVFHVLPKESAVRPG